MIYYNLNTINDWNFGDDNIIKVYRHGAVVFYKFDSEQGGYKVCFAVVDDITQYSETEFEDVFDKATEKWYKLNNLNVYEQYGVYGSGRNVTTYEGKLTIDDGYEYQYSGGSWVNVGEVSGSTATLPDIPFVLNYNAKNYDAATHSIPMTSGQLNDTDAVAYNNPNNIVDHSADGYITVSNSSMRIRKQGQNISLFNRSSNSTSSDLTIVCKAKTTSGENIITNRDGNYNWMYRLKTSGQLRFHGTSETGSIAWNTSNPDIMSVRTYYSSGTKLVYNNWTQNTSTSPTSFTYGSTNGDSSSAGALFVGYGWNSTNEQWSGDFYWVYMAQANLTDAQIQEVIDYNEGGGQSEYPVYYSEKSDPLDNLTFNTLADAQAYAEANCVYDGMHATIDGDRYYFDSTDENGWVKVTEYYVVEDVTPSGGSGWTISGSSTYNPDLSYYDDFDLETDWTSYAYKIAKITIFGYDHFTYYLRAYSSYSAPNAYLMASNIDELSSVPTNMTYASNSAVVNTYDFRHTAGSAVNLNNYRRVTYNNLDKTVEHTFYVVFYGRKYSNYTGDATILIPKEQTNENWEQVTFSASSNVASSQKNLYIDDNYTSSNGSTNYFYYRWMIGLPSGSHSSYTNYSNYDYCPNVTSSTFTSVAGNSRQVNFTYDNTTSKSLSMRLVDSNGNVLSPSDTVYYTTLKKNSCNINTYEYNLTYPRTQVFKVGGSFYFQSSSNRHYIYGYTAPTLGTWYYVDNYSTTFDIVYTALTRESVSVTYTTYDPNDSETPTFKTDITYPYNGGTTSSTTLTSFDVPYTYPYEVSQTNDKFSADSQSYTANQAARTINFVLYPNNREFASVADLEAYAYAWEGMKAYVGDTNYEYKNGEWVEQAYTQYEYIRTENNAARYYNFNTNFYPTTANTFEVKVEFVDRSVDWGAIILWRPGSSSNFEFDTVTSSYQAIIRTGGNNGVSYRPTIGANNPTVYTLPLSASSGTYSVNGGATQTIQYNYTPMQLPASMPMGIFGQATGKDLKGAVCKLYYIKVFDGNGNIVKYYIPSDSNGTPCFYEIVNGDYILNTYTGSDKGTCTLGPEI